MSLLITGGEVITHESRRVADLWIEGETIQAVEPNFERDRHLPDGTRIINAAGKLVFPGFIDPHVHIHLPFMRTFAKDTYASASVAALIGGTTTFIEMACPTHEQRTLAGYNLWKSKAADQSACDYAFHIAVSRFDEETAADLREIVADGTTSFKVFLAYKGVFGVDDGDLYETLRLAAGLGVIVTAHCENADVVSHLQQELLKQGKRGPEWHEPSRPEAVEAEGTARFCTFLELTGARGYVVHLSCARALAAAMDARARGINVGVEVVVPHLLLDRAHAALPFGEGLKYVMSPPLRDKGNHDALWAALAAGVINTVGTDHCPFDQEQKAMGIDNFTLIPNGIPGIEDRVNLLYTYGVAQKRISIHRFVDALSTQPAKLFDLYPRKGAIEVGSDADVVVYDPSYRGRIRAASHHMNTDYSAYEGMQLEGRADTVILRGKVQVENGAFVGDRTHGRFLRRRVAGREHGS